MKKVAKIFIENINYIDGEMYIRIYIYIYIFFIKDLIVPNLAHGGGFKYALVTLEAAGRN